MSSNERRGPLHNVDPLGSLLWRIDSLPADVVEEEQREILKDIALYTDFADLVSEAIDFYDSEKEAFTLRRLADHSPAAEETKRMRKQRVVPIRLDLMQGTSRLTQPMTPRTLVNTHAHREATVREVFCAYDKDRSGHIECCELAALLRDLGFPADFADKAFQIADTNDDDMIDFGEFLSFYNTLIERLRGVGPSSGTFVGRALFQHNDSRIYYTWEYKQLCVSADAFYGSEEPSFCDELVEEALNYVDSLRDPPADLPQDLHERARVLVEARDKYTMFALYKYHHAEDEQHGATSLRLYLQYKVDTASRHESYLIKRKASLERFEQERREIIDTLRRRDSFRDRSSAAEDLLRSKAAKQKQQANVQRLKRAVAKKPKPRWLALYELHKKKK